MWGEAKKKQHACIEYSTALSSQTSILTDSMTDEGEAVSRSVHLIGFNDVLAKPPVLLTGLMRLCTQALHEQLGKKTIVRGPAIGSIEKMSTGCLT